MSAVPVTELPLVKSRSRRRWEGIDDQRRTLFKVKSNQIRLVERLGFVIPEREIAMIKPRTYDEENVFYRNQFLGRIMPEMHGYHQGLIREGLEDAPTGGIYTDRFIAGGQYYKYDPHTNLRTGFLMVIYIDDNQAESAVTVSYLNTQIAKINTLLKIIPDDFHLMYILPKPISRVGKADIIKGGSFELTILEDWQLYVNAVDHVLNQTYIKTTPEMAETVMEKLRKPKSALPRIQISDPNAIVNGWVENDVIMVIRRDVLTGGPELLAQYRVINASAQDLIKRV